MKKRARKELHNTQLTKMSEKVGYEKGDESAGAGKDSAAEGEGAVRHQKCQKYAIELMADKKIQYILGHIASIGCTIPTPFFSCRTCEDNISGGYISGYNPEFDDDEVKQEGTASGNGNEGNLTVVSELKQGERNDEKEDLDYKGPKIILCENKLVGKRSFYRDIIVHELIHAFDDCRSRINMRNCYQHACTEVCRVFLRSLLTSVDSRF